MEEITRGSGIFLNPYRSGKGLTQEVKDIINKSKKLDEIGKKTQRNTLKNASDYFLLERKVDGIFLPPYK